MCNLCQNLKLVEGGQYLVEVELQKEKLENYANTKLLDFHNRLLENVKTYTLP